MKKERCCNVLECCELETSVTLVAKRHQLEEVGLGQNIVEDSMAAGRLEGVFSMEDHGAVARLLGLGKNIKGTILQDWRCVRNVT